MNVRAYYNEFDPYAAQWLRNLIAAGHIAPGDVDERSIVDVRPSDLDGYTQCHFFAGIGGWSEALHIAGWPDDRSVWTGSCPCQPFSAAGKRKAGADERHLWPVWHGLIRECRPDTVFGEQVEAAIGLGWLDRVFADLEGEGYACGAQVLGSHSVGAPNIRQRLWWVADAEQPGEWRGRLHEPDSGTATQSGRAPDKPERSGPARGLAHPDGGLTGDGNVQPGRQHGQQPQDGGTDRGLEYSESQRSIRGAPDGWEAWRGAKHAGDTSRLVGVDQPGPQGWGERLVECPYQWPPGTPNLAVLCTDGKARRVEPGTFPLAHGVPARVGRLRAYGNAINPYVAAEFIRAYLDLGEHLTHAS